MREKYLDIMENIFREYSIERVDSFLNEVKQNGLTEHGFPVLTCVLGNLIANNRCKEYGDVFIFSYGWNFCIHRIQRKKIYKTKSSFFVVLVN